MSLKIVRNDITKMDCDAIVNTANEFPTYSSGCDEAVYQAAGVEELLAYRKEKIGRVPEGEAFVTPAFQLPQEMIIHTVSPRYIDGNSGEEEKLRSCYKNSLRLAHENGCESVAFPLIATGSFGYPREEGLRIAVDEINAFLMQQEMEVTLVVFDDQSTKLGRKLYPGLEHYIDINYVNQKRDEEYGTSFLSMPVQEETGNRACRKTPSISGRMADLFSNLPARKNGRESVRIPEESGICASSPRPREAEDQNIDFDFEEQFGKKLQERMKHRQDSFSEYLMYLIEEKGMTNADVYKRAIVDKKVFSKIKNTPDYHPQKITALCLCVGARLNLDEAKDLLARAGYALSPCDKMDIIFSFFIENGIYDMIELDIQLEQQGLKCIIE